MVRTCLPAVTGGCQIGRNWVSAAKLTLIRANVIRLLNSATHLGLMITRLESVMIASSDPKTPDQADEEVVEMITVEALDRFNIDTKERAMRIISSYAQQVNHKFPYRPTTPETCLAFQTNKPETAPRSELELSEPRFHARGQVDGVYINTYEYVISEGCGDWVLDTEALAQSYGGAFFYEEPLDRFNSDNTDFGIRPVHALSHPTRFIYRPTSPDECRYYLANASFSRQVVDDLFESSAVNGERRGGYDESTDLGGWYNYEAPVEIRLSWPHNFMISENCGDWVRHNIDEVPEPDRNQIFDYPYRTYGRGISQG